jgi:phage-related holin
VIIAYLINESGSILENIENLGYGSIIPEVLRKGLKAINQKNSNLSEVKK